MPIWGVPILERVVENLRDWGVDDIVFNSHWKADQIAQWVDQYKKRCQDNGEKLSVRVNYEPEILGTGGVLNPLRDWISDEPFFLVNGDIVFANAENPALMDGFADKSVIGSCLVTQEGPRTIEVEKECSFVTNWRSFDSGMEGTFTYCGVACLKPDILNYIEQEGFSSIVSAYEKAMMDGKFIKCLNPSEMLWTDAGTISTLIDLNRDEQDNSFAEFPQLKEILAKLSLEGTDIEFWSARGSERVFFKCDKGVIILYDDSNRVENALYAGHSRYLLSKGVSVPKVVLDLPEIKSLVLEFAGKEKSLTYADYIKVIDLLLLFGPLANDPEIGNIGLLAPFDSDTWKWERELFEKYCLRGMFNTAMPKDVLDELMDVAKELGREPLALVHRDFQSTNIMWKDDEPVLIDFQGMRLGPQVYDLASLIYDPYVKVDEEERTRLIDYYVVKSSRSVGRLIYKAAVQRLIQCLGAYGRLIQVGQNSFSKFIIPALENLYRASINADLKSTADFAHELLAKADKNHAAKCSCHHHS
jgi:aminoglycoside/choline kinase family phosphotransferase/dTDP-glucose pyrophosphorylase